MLIFFHRPPGSESNLPNLSILAAMPAASGEWLVEIVLSLLGIAILARGRRAGGDDLGGRLVVGAGLAGLAQRDDGRAGRCLTGCIAQTPPIAGVRGRHDHVLPADGHAGGQTSAEPGLAVDRALAVGGVGAAQRRMVAVQHRNGNPCSAGAGFCWC